MFGLALFFSASLLVVATWLRLSWLPAVGFGCTLLLEYSWQIHRFTAPMAGLSVFGMRSSWGSIWRIPSCWLDGDRCPWRSGSRPP